MYNCAEVSCKSDFSRKRVIESAQSVTSCTGHQPEAKNTNSIEIQIQMKTQNHNYKYKYRSDSQTKYSKISPLGMIEGSVLKSFSKQRAADCFTTSKVSLMINMM